MDRETGRSIETHPAEGVSELYTDYHVAVTFGLVLPALLYLYCRERERERERADCVDRLHVP